MQGIRNGIIRIERAKNYASIPNDLLRDVRLSYKARGILAYLLSHSDSWFARPRDVVNNSNQDGKTAVYSAFKELREFGYARIVSIYQNGKIVRREWRIYDIPQSAEKLRSGFLNEGNLNQENRDVTKDCNKRKTVTERKNDELPASGAIGKSSRFSELENLPVKHKTGFSEAINLFHAFAKSRNFHTRGEKQGKIIYVKNAHEGGWRRQALLEWESRYQALLKRTGSEERIIKTLKWFIANFDNPWVPHCEAFSTFADRFGSIDKMRRREMGESQAFRNGEHKGKNGAPKIKYDMIDGRKVANYEEFV